MKQKNPYKPTPQQWLKIKKICTSNGFDTFAAPEFEQALTLTFKALRKKAKERKYKSSLAVLQGRYIDSMTGKWGKRPLKAAEFQRVFDWVATLQKFCLKRITDDAKHTLATLSMYGSCLKMKPKEIDAKKEGFKRMLPPEEIPTGSLGHGFLIASNKIEWGCAVAQILTKHAKVAGKTKNGKSDVRGRACHVASLILRVTDIKVSAKAILKTFPAKE